MKNWSPLSKAVKTTIKALGPLLDHFLIANPVQNRAVVQLYSQKLGMTIHNSDTSQKEHWRAFSTETSLQKVNQT